MTPSTLLIALCSAAAVWTPSASACLVEDLACVPSQLRPSRENRSASLVDADASSKDDGEDPRSGCMVLRRQLCEEPEAAASSPDAWNDGGDDASTSNDDGPGRFFEPGSLVELYAEGSVLATPAVIVERHRAASGATTYDLKHALTGGRPSGVDARFVHPYEAYEDGADARCNVSHLRGVVLMTSCTVVSRLEREGSPVAYRVSYMDEAGEEARRLLPYSRVQRIILRQEASE